MLDTSTILHLLMWPAIILVTIVAIVGFVSAVFAKQGAVPEKKEKPAFLYSARQYFMTGAEREFYNMLGQAVGAEYRIFAQVHLDAILDEQVKGQNWKAARAHISQKSVDFVLCDKEDLGIVAVIELDDKTHNRPDRIERDSVVERILRESGMTLVRFATINGLQPADIGTRIRDSVARSKA